MMTPELFADVTGMAFDATEHQCHAASLALVKSGYYPVARVARGWCPGVGVNHSWVVLSENCYDQDAYIVDPSLWSYVEEVDGIWEGTGHDWGHIPKGGMGTIWDSGKPPEPEGEIIELRKELSIEAMVFMEMLAPNGLDAQGWMHVAHLPVIGWPAAEIIGAMYAHPRLKVMIPIDVVGMLLDVNPRGLYR